MFSKMRFFNLHRLKQTTDFFLKQVKPEISTSRSFSTFFEDNPLQQYYKIKMTSELRENLERVDELRTEIQQLRSKTNGNLNEAIQTKLRFLWTYNSNAIEGSKLSLGDTIFFLQEGLTVGGKTLKDYLDAQNHSEAIDYLYDTVKNKLPIDAFLLKSLNAILMKGVDFIPGLDANGNPIQRKLISGQYKKGLNYVIQPDGTTHQYVEPFLVPQQVEDLCQWIKTNPENYHPCLVSAIAHYNMVRIHPFQDGNGRGARLLMNIILMREHYYPANIEIEKRKEYLDCLKLADKGELVPFCLFVAGSLVNTQNIVLDEIKNYQSSNSFSK